jgi:hypothetical protein
MPWKARSFEQGVPSGRKHLLLLAVLILLQIGQPLLEHRRVITRVLSDSVFVAICLYVFFIVCTQRWQRVVGGVLFALVLSGNLALYTQDPSFHRLLGALFHCALIVFLGFAVGVILQNLFSQTVIKADDVIGAICGYMLGAMVWGNLYALAYLFVPGAFNVNPAITVQLEDWQLKRSLFDYLSFTTLTSLGYGDITPVGQPAFSLTWLEVLFGQFYMAVVVAQLVGMKLAQAISHRGQG